MPHRNKRKPPRIKPLMMKAAREMELTADLFSGMARLEFSGNREAVVDGCRGILEYDENVIRLKTGAFTLRFTGRGLRIRSLTDTTAVVSGFIASVEFLDAVK